MKIEVLQYGTHAVRMAMKDGLPVWVVADVCRVLEIDNVTQVVARLDPDEVCSTEVIDAMGRTQTASAVTESGLYSLILGSRKPEAKDFKRWVTREVLPSIRKTGVYLVTTDTPESRLALMQHMITSMIEQHDEVVRQGKEIELVKEQLADMGATTGYFTVVGYARKHNLRCPSDYANQIGRRASYLCRQRGIRIGVVENKTWGTVNSYPEEIIKEVIND